MIDFSTLDLVSFEIKSAWTCLGEITGNDNNEDIIVFDPDNDEGDYTNLNPVSTEEGSMFASTTSYSDKLVDGLIVYLKKADPYSHYNMGDLIYFDAGAETGKEWKKYTGKITV